MKSSDLIGFRMALPGNTPFAGGTNAEVEIPVVSGQFSMQDGFGPNYDNPPASDGSNMVQRGQVNYIGKMASYAQFMGQCGKGYWEFDPAVCTAIGGYPKGAVLTLVDSGCYLKIVSLIDDNKFDFTGGTDTSAYPEVTNGAVDGVNWQYLSLDPKTLLDQEIVAKVYPMVFHALVVQHIGAFKANNNAAVVVEGGLSIETDQPEDTCSVFVILSPKFESLDELDGWEGWENGIGRAIYSNGTAGTVTSEQAIVQKNGYYGVAVVGVGGVGGSSDKTFRVTSSDFVVRLKAI